MELRRCPERSPDIHHLDRSVRRYNQATRNRSYADKRRAEGYVDVKVFISWSGDLSRALAVELRQWLPMVVHQVDAWISGREIGPGQRWALALGRELAESHFGIICLTADNLESPWILFEAGAVSRSLEARVVPLLFGIKPSDLAGPRAQFQSVQADRSEERRVG